MYNYFQMYLFCAKHIKQAPLKLYPAQGQAFMGAPASYISFTGNTCIRLTYRLRAVRRIPAEAHHSKELGQIVVLELVIVVEEADLVLHHLVHGLHAVRIELEGLAHLRVIGKRDAQLLVEGILDVG